MKNLCNFCPIVWRLDQISGTVRPCNWSSPDMVPLSRPPVFVPNSTLVTCLLEEFWAGRWQSPPKAVLNLNLSDLLLRKLEIYIAERKTSQKNVEPRCKSDSGFTKTSPTWKYWNTEIGIRFSITGVVFTEGVPVSAIVAYLWLEGSCIKYLNTLNKVQIDQKSAVGYLLCLPIVSQSL